MKQELKDKWLAALRSGEYTQGKGWLKYQDNDGIVKWCCLGVLADITDNTKWTVFYPAGIPIDSLKDNRIYYQYDKPPDDGGWVKFGSTSMYTEGLKEPWTLASMNDGSVMPSLEPKSFLEIADWIEENVEVENEPRTTGPVGTGDECTVPELAVEKTV